MKSFEVMSDILRCHPLQKEDWSFLDFGSAPGGFASVLSATEGCTYGCGVTMPWERGGFHMHFQGPNFDTVFADLFEVTLESLQEQGHTPDVCVGDSQNLKIRTTNK